MSDLAAPLLATFTHESHAYVAFVALMRRLGPNFCRSGETMTAKFSHLSEAIRVYDPVLFAYLVSVEADDLLFCYRWLLLELKREFVFEDALTMMEVLWSSLPPSPPTGEEGLPLFEKKFTLDTSGTQHPTATTESTLATVVRSRRRASSTSSTGSDRRLRRARPGLIETHVSKTEDDSEVNSSLDSSSVEVLTSGEIECYGTGPSSETLRSPSPLIIGDPRVTAVGMNSPFEVIPSPLIPAEEAEEAKPDGEARERPMRIPINKREGRHISNGACLRQVASEPEFPKPSRRLFLLQRLREERQNRKSESEVTAKEPEIPSSPPTRIRKFSDFQKLTPTSRKVSSDSETKKNETSFSLDVFSPSDPEEVSPALSTAWTSSAPSESSDTEMLSDSISHTDLNSSRDTGRSSSFAKGSQGTVSGKFSLGNEEAQENGSYHSDSGLEERSRHSTGVNLSSGNQDSQERKHPATQSEQQQTPCVGFSKRGGRKSALPPPSEFGAGCPFLMFLCLSILFGHREHILRNRLDANEIAMYFDRLVRKHNVRRVLHHARLLYASYMVDFAPNTSSNAM